MTEGLALIVAAAFGYALGSVPFGLLLTRAAGHGDIRAVGSGNIGATNVLRTGSRGLAALTLLCDAGKGFLALWLAARWGEPAAMAAGAGAFAGHLYPVWLGFRGGKGVATYLGLLAAAQPPAALGFATLWLAVGLTTRLSSLAALLATVATSLGLWLADRPDWAVFFAALGLVLIARHRANIRRLLAGTESRIGRRP